MNLFFFTFTISTGNKRAKTISSTQKKKFSNSSKTITRTVLILIKISYKDFAETPAVEQPGISTMESFAITVNG